MKKILTVFLVVLLTFTLWGCNNTETTSPSATVEAMLEDFKDQKFDRLSNHFDKNISIEKSLTMDGNLNNANKQMKNTFLSKLTDIDYKILDETISEDGKKATVIVKITSHNIAEKLLEGVSLTLPKLIKITTSGGTYEEIQEQLFTSVFTPLENTTKTQINTINVKLVLKNNQWKLSIVNEEFLSSITGGMMDILNKFNFLMK